MTKKRGFVLVDLGDGVERRFRFTFNAIASLEDYFGKPITAVFQEMQGDGQSINFKARDMIKIFHAGLTGGGETVTEEEIGNLMHFGEFGVYVKKMAEAFNVALTGDETPPKPAPEVGAGRVDPPGLQ